MSDENEFEPRHSAQTTLLFPCQGEEECAPSLSTFFTPPCPGYIVGQVTDVRTGDPLDGITVWLESPQTGSFGEDTTDALGHYAVGSLDAGEGYVLIASGPSYSYRLLQDGVLPEAGLVQNIEMIRTGVVKGTIYDANGQTIENARVFFNQQSIPSWGVGHAATNEKGEFYSCALDVEISPTQGSNYKILATHPDYSYIEGQHFIDTFYSPADEAELVATMQPRGTISGLILVDGTALAGIAVSIESSSGLMLDKQVTYTNGAGYFDLVVDAPSTYELITQGEGTELKAFASTVSPGQTSISPLLNLAGSGSMGGYVVDLSGQPISGAWIKVLTSEGKGPLFVGLTDAAGEYSINGVNPYNWLVTASTTGSTLDTQFPRQEVSVAPGVLSNAHFQVDTSPPLCYLSNPILNATVSGTVAVTVEAQDNQGLLKLAFDVDGEEVDAIFVGDVTDTTFSVQKTHDFSWDTSKSSNGSLSLRARAYDLSGHQAVSETVTVVVSNT